MTTTPGTRPPLDHTTLNDTLLGNGPVWTSIEVLPETPSTNAIVVERAREGAPQGVVVAAEHQTAGRGRLDRTWETPPRAALTVSVLLRPEAVPAERWSWLPLLAGVAVVEGVAAAGGPRCLLKWPNDVLVDGRKVGGLLVERVDSQEGPAAVVGIGINVSQTRAELPVPEASSLGLEGRAPDRTLLLLRVLEELGRRYDAWSRGQGDPALGLLEDYRERCATLGHRVEVHLPDGRVVEGVATAVSDDGSLVVDAGAEAPLVVRAGDVLHVRAAG